MVAVVRQLLKNQSHTVHHHKMIPFALSIEMHIILSRHICLHKIQSKAHRTVGIFHVQNDSIRTVHPNATDVGRAMKIQSKAHRTVGADSVKNMGVHMYA